MQMILDFIERFPQFVHRRQMLATIVTKFSTDYLWLSKNRKCYQMDFWISKTFICQAAKQDVSPYLRNTFMYLHRNWWTDSRPCPKGGQKKSFHFQLVPLLKTWLFFFESSLLRFRLHNMLPFPVLRSNSTVKPLNRKWGYFPAMLLCICTKVGKITHRWR